MQAQTITVAETSYDLRNPLPGSPVEPDCARPQVPGESMLDVLLSSLPYEVFTAV